MSKLGYSQRIKQRIADLEAQIAFAQSELDELRIAERVLNRLGTGTDEKGPDDGQSRTSTTKDGTVAGVAVNALKAHGPMDTLALLKVMQQEWRADLKQTTLASTLSRIKLAGSVNQIDGKWYAGSLETAEPPEGSSEENVDEGHTSSDMVAVKLLF